MTLDLVPEIDALCEKFGIETRNVLSIELIPGKAYVTVAFRNEEDKFYLQRGGGGIAKKTLQFPLKQFPLTVVEP